MNVISYKKLSLSTYLGHIWKYRQKIINKMSLTNKETNTSYIWLYFFMSQAFLISQYHYLYQLKHCILLWLIPHKKWGLQLSLSEPLQGCNVSFIQQIGSNKIYKNITIINQIVIKTRQNNEEHGVCIWDKVYIKAKA